MDYQIVGIDHIFTARLNGSLTFNDYEKVRTLSREVGKHKVTSAVLHIDGLDFVDSSGLGMLLIVQEELQKQGKGLVLKGARGQVQRVLAVADLGRVLTIEE